MAAPVGRDAKVPLRSAARGAAVGAAAGAGAGAGAGVRAGADAGMDAALPADMVLFAQREGAADCAIVRAARDDFVADLKKQIMAELGMSEPLDALTLHVATLGASGITLGPALDSTTTIETALGGLTGTIRIVVKESIAAGAGGRSSAVAATGLKGASSSSAGGGAGLAPIRVQHWLRRTMHVVPLLREYDAFRVQVEVALALPRSCKLYWAAGPPTMVQLADHRLPATFESMLSAYGENPGLLCVYAFEQPEAKVSPTSLPEEGDVDRLGDLTPARKLVLRGSPRSGESSSSASGSSPASSDRSSAFKECVSAYDKKCVLCGETAAPEAAHIIPLRAIKEKSKLDVCLLDAQLDRSSINIAQNGMRLCATHHTAFDAYQWTVDPADMKVVVAANAPESIRRFVGAMLDFSGRTPSFFAPPKCIWDAYYKHLFEPSTRQSKVGTRSGAGSPSALAATSEEST